ncbi:unnamed protein product [Lepeophtheirus salmonis]|uniref:WD repeat-containing protein 37 n=1 Tax=Lepeophtheirus salmonis TaxID=72036 RepID=A0A7R8CSE2_LEPSM|nr:unnamed protein product [Lepeophtheirus salmonis]CAF2878741.1 unnamed protein product [Lepeophtheirus salmonis]
MPRDKTSTKGGVSSSSNTRTKTQQHCRHSSMDEMPFPTTSTTSLPPTLRIRLHELFVQIEKEFEMIYQDNLSLQEKVDILTERSKASSNNNNPSRGNYPEFDHSKSSSTHFVLGSIAQRAEYDIVDGKALSTLGSSHSANNANNNTHLTTNTNEPNKGPSHSKAPYTQKLRRYTGHKDGIWEVTVSRMGLPIIGTASADHSATIWGMHSGQALLNYTGHCGSVNSLRFHPTKELVLTASGDGTVHIWQCAVHLYNESSSGRVASSEDELDPIEKEYMAEEDNNQYTVLRTPLRSLNGHNGGVVIAAGTGCHPMANKLSRQDGIDLHGIKIRVTSAVFTKDDQVVSGSDDRSVKIWDLRNMRNPVATIQSDSSINTLAVSPAGLQDFLEIQDKVIPEWCAVQHGPQDNLGRPNLFTCGFDRVTLGWSIQPREIKDGDGGISTQIGHGTVSISNAGNQGQGQGSNSKQNPRNKD